MTVRIMVDIETIGTQAGCSILSIGACRFDGGIVDSGQFYQIINRKSSRQAGLVEGQATLDWWATQSFEAQRTLRDATTGGASLGAALYRFQEWLLSWGTNIEIWGNGADFDLPILAYAHLVAGFGAPWKPYVGRCYRTLKNLRPDIKMVRTGPHHDALADAIDQATHAIELLRALGVEP